MRTVLGSVFSPGHTQPHEHIFVRRTPAAEKYPALEISDIDRSLEELIAYKGSGGAALVEAQPVAAGRDARALVYLSRQSGISIVACTGFHMPMFYEPDSDILTADEGALYERFLRELTVGLEECVGREMDEEYLEGIPTPRAGVVKAAIGKDGAVGGFAVRLRAAARAAAEAGVPLMLHTEAGAGAVGAIALCETCGLSPERILLCHADRQTSDFAPHREIAATGAYLEYDTIGRFKYHADTDEVQLILHMLERGYGDKLLLSLDTTAQRLYSYGGEIGLAYLIRTFLPMLKSAGVSDADIARMTRDNPAQALRET